VPSCRFACLSIFLQKLAAVFTRRFDVVDSVPVVASGQLRNFTAA